jgi:glucosamine kinase
VSGGFVVGIDGGGTQTTVALADLRGREILRREGPPGIVDPRRPETAAEVVAEVVRGTMREAGLRPPAASLCAGLAGVAFSAQRDAVLEELKGLGLAELVRVVDDGKIALQGALGSTPGILLIAGTGSVAYGRGEDGRTARCGGWGMTVGDEGSGYWIGRGAVRAALQAADGRGPPTRLLADLLDELRLPGPAAVPPWVGRAEKRDLGALVPLVVRAAQSGDGVAATLLRDAAHALATHAAALAVRLGSWSGSVPLVLHGGVFRQAEVRDEVERLLNTLERPFVLRSAAADAPAGAVQLAIEMLSPSELAS